MTVKELIEKLREFQSNTEVMIRDADSFCWDIKDVYQLPHKGKVYIDICTDE